MRWNDLLLALLLPLPPWLGFQIFRRKGRVGLSYGYFLGGILAILTLPWPEISREPMPTAQMGGALFGFTLFLQAHREGAQGLRRLGVGLGGASVFSLLLVLQLGLSWRALPIFWATAVFEGLLWLLLSDLGFRITQGQYLPIRMPIVGGLAVGIGSLLHRALPAALHLEAPRLHWLSSLLAGVLLGLVALQQLLWMRKQGTWIEGRGEGLRVALSMIDRTAPADQPGLIYGIDASQAMLLVNEKGMVLEGNGPLSHELDLPRHQLRGYRLDALMQGGDVTVWQDLQTQLLQHGAAHASATLVRKDGEFREIRVEAVGFDRNMALVWIADAESNSLALRGERGSVLSDTLEGTPALANALGSILPAAEQILLETEEKSTREAAELILTAAQRLRPTAPLTFSALDATEEMESLLPTLQKMLPQEFKVQHRTPSVRIRSPKEALRRIVIHLTLHARQTMQSGTLTLSMERRILGGRHWALLSVEREGTKAKNSRELLGLSWLRQAVRDARGMLELSQDEQGNPWPSVHLPLDGSDGEAAIDQSALFSRRIWILDQDPLVREALASLVRLNGGEAKSFSNLRELLKESRTPPAPDVLVIERHAKLDRFQPSLRGLQREPIPTLILGSGQTLSIDPAKLNLRRLGFLEKPFPSQEFIQSLLALMA
jgi:hypothetical protein